MKVLTYDDDAKFTGIISDAILQIEKKHDGVFDGLVCFNDVISVIKYVDKYRDECANTVFLLDIIAGKEPVGYDLARHIKQVLPDSIIIYITDFPNIVIQNMRENIDALGFVIKTSPKFFEELEYALLRAYRILDSAFFIEKNNREVFRIKHDDIFYFEKLKESRYVRVVHKDGRNTFRGSLVALLERLEDYFRYADKVHVVNTRNIKRMDKEESIIYFDNGVKCSFSSTRKNDLMQWMKE